ncbi:MAG: GyrI-like domain-containing protein [bacterium]|nr:GyrI-like domain-containing protein [bacterium]
MEKIDLKKELKEFYAPRPAGPRLIELPSFNYLSAEGQGDPNQSAEFKGAVEALFSLSYALKFHLKKGPLGIDYAVMPLEGLWWAPDMTHFKERRDKSQWQWRLLIHQPQWVDAEMVERLRGQVGAKKDLPWLSRLEFGPFAEGPCAQVLHQGPFDDEGPTISRLHQFIANQGKSLAGLHHEIYLSDIRRGNPANWKTLIRQPYT